MSDERPKKILIIEDEPTQRIIAKEYLESAGYSVRSSEDGLHGLNMAVKTLPDLIMLDLMLPSIDGYELCSKLKTQVETAHIPVILFTGSKDPDVVKKGLEVGADDFIIKPIDWQFLEDRVNFVLSKNEAQKDDQAEADQSASDSAEAALQAENDALRAQVEDLQNEASVAQTCFAEIEKTDEDKLRAVEAEAQSTLGLLNSEEQNQVDDLTDQLEAAQSKHKEELDRISAEYEAKLDTQKQEFEAERQALEEQHAFKLALASEQQAAEPAQEGGDVEQDLADRHSDQMAAILKIVEEQCSGYEDSLTKISALLSVDNETKSDPKQQLQVSKELDLMVHGITRLKKFTEILTDQSNLNVSDVEVNQFITEFADRLRHVSEKRKVSLDVVPLPDPVIVSLDQNRVRYALTLLAIHALQLTPPSGKVTVSSVVDGDGSLKISMSDDGVGLSPKQLERYQQCLDQPVAANTKQSDRIGLELPVATALTRQLQIGFELDSRQGEGLSASLVFPRDAIVQPGARADEHSTEADVA